MTAVKRCRCCGELRPSERYEPRRATCRDCNNARARARGPRPYSREQWLKQKYGITVDDFESLLAVQRNRCALGHPFRGKVVVDHDHRTGVVRGLLCERCNLGIGHLLDSPALCRRARTYLELFGSGPPLS